MKGRATVKSKTPLNPPLHPQGVCWRVPRSFAATLPRTGGKGDHFCADKKISKLTSARGDISPPLTRGGREGFAFIPYDKNLTAFARENRKHPTAAESKLWFQLLRMRNLSAYKFTRQKPIAHFIVDFYCAELRLAIEIDGDSHAESVSYDLQRTQVLNKLAVSVVRYTNDNILNNLPGVYVVLMRRVAMLKGTA